MFRREHCNGLNMIPYTRVKVNTHQLMMATVPTSSLPFTQAHPQFTMLLGRWGHGDICRSAEGPLQFSNAISRIAYTSHVKLYQIQPEPSSELYALGHAPSGCASKICVLARTGSKIPEKGSESHLIQSSIFNSGCGSTGTSEH